MHLASLVQHRVRSGCSEHADSMGLDIGHMDYRHLSQAIPPDYATYVIGQAVIGQAPSNQCRMAARAPTSSCSISSNEMTGSPNSDLSTCIAACPIT